MGMSDPTAIAEDYVEIITHVYNATYNELELSFWHNSYF
jgi:hypothetical protein